MTGITQRRFDSLRDFVARFDDLFRGPTFAMTLIRLDPRLRERVMLAVSVANNCHG